MTEPNIKQKLKAHFLGRLPDVDFASLRYVKRRSEYIRIRRNTPEPVRSFEDQGVMVAVIKDNGSGYAATSDLSENGVGTALSEALAWADLTRRHPLVDYSGFEPLHPRGGYQTPVQKPWDDTPLQDKLGMLSSVCENLNISDRIVDWETALWGFFTDAYYVTSGGGEVFQELRYAVPDIQVTANEGSETQKRTLGGLRAFCRQSGLEALDEIGFTDIGKQIAEEALILLDAPDCPSGTMDLLLDASQMVLQIHESVGHPLEIDRILGDERNYAGTSFVSPDMFGTYRYGSDLMNIVFDPSRPYQFASYGFDDEGAPARKRPIIENGILKRGLGGRLSQHRSGLPGAACARASGWGRPPIDRMANLNLEPGESSMEEMIASVEKGVYMADNASWSIDDSRNKFQFGCEYGRRIQNGRLTDVVKKPNYRGISATFWRNLKMTGNQDTFRVLGTPYCGKGEPNQLIHVGHATPACLFSDVDVFGGE